MNNLSHLENAIMVIGGNRLFPTTRWAEVLNTHNLLQLFVPALYCFRRYDPYLKILETLPWGWLGKRIDRFKQFRCPSIPDDKVIHVPASEFLSHYFSSGLPGYRNLNYRAAQSAVKKQTRLVKRLKPENPYL